MCHVETIRAKPGGCPLRYSIPEEKCGDDIPRIGHAPNTRLHGKDYFGAAVFQIKLLQKNLIFLKYISKID